MRKTLLSITFLFSLTSFGAYNCFPGYYDNEIANFIVNENSFPSTTIGIKAIGAWKIKLTTRLRPVTGSPNEFYGFGVVKGVWSSITCEYPMDIKVYVSDDCRYLELTANVPSMFYEDCTFDKKTTTYHTSFDRTADGRLP